MQNKDIRILGLSAAALTLLLSAGCAKTPDQAVVRQKGGDSLAQYQEADTAEADTRETAPESDGISEGQDKADANISSTNVLAQRLQVPERYIASDSEGIYELACDAQVIVPDVEKVSVWKVSQREFSQELIDRVTEVFFGDLPVYNGYTYFDTTKAEALEQLNKLKAWQAEGSHPYGSYLTDASEIEVGVADGEDEFGLPTLQEQIDMWEEVYAAAPEERARYEVEPAFGTSYYQDEAGGKDYLDERFYGAVETDDGATYSYRLEKIPNTPMDIYIERQHGIFWNGILNWYQPEESDDASDLPPREELTAMAEITPEKAQEMTDAWMEQLGLAEEFSAKAVNLSVCKVSEDIDGTTYHLDSAGWQVDYTRDVDGFPVTDEEDWGGSLESIDDMTTETWGYERIEFTVNGDGLQEAHIMNLYDVGERQVENVQMLSFPEIAGIFEQMLRIQNADLDYDTHIGYQVDRAELGYMRIYDPGTDSRSGLLVPVWDFFGQETHEYDYEGEIGSYTTNRPQYSFLTINAADGTVINRGLGY